jgi:hypothetical protein
LREVPLLGGPPALLPLMPAKRDIYSPDPGGRTPTNPAPENGSVVWKEWERPLEGMGASSGRNGSAEWNFMGASSGRNGSAEWNFMGASSGSKRRVLPAKWALFCGGGRVAYVV